MPKKNGNVGNTNEVGNGGDGKQDTGKDFEPIIVDPADIDEPAGSGNDSGGNSDNAPRKRGRPKGSRNFGGSGKTGRAKASSALDLDGLSAIFLSTHSMLAVLTKTQELALDKAEADNLANGVANVARHYDISGASQKTLDWFNLIQVLALVYGTRMFALRGKFKKKPKVAQPAQDVSGPPPENDHMNGIILDQFGNVVH